MFRADAFKATRGSNMALGMEDIVHRILSTFIVLVVSALLSGPTYSQTGGGKATYWTLLLMPGCMKNVSGFSSRAKEPYEKWRQQHTQEAMELEKQMSPMPNTEVPDKQLEQLRTQCEQLLNYILDDMLPADARFATPGETWNVFVEALRSGDKSSIAECFSPDGRTTYVSAFEQMTSVQLADIGNSFTGIQLLKDGTETYQEAAVTRSNGVAGIALFVRTKRGWLLSQL
jgi:hypothetical protein